MNTVRAGAIVLEPQRTAHASEMFRVLQDPAIYEFENFAPESEEWLTRRFAALESRRSPSGEQYWLNWVVRVPSGGVVTAAATLKARNYRSLALLRSPGFAAESRSTPPVAHPEADEIALIKMLGVD